MTRLRPYTVVLLCCWLPIHGTKVDDTIHYAVSFDHHENVPTGESLVKENEKQLQQSETISIRTADNENYVCHLPKVEDEGLSPISSYSGPSPSELIKPLYKEKVCSLRFEAYWSYELCHGRYVLQYHEEKGSSAGRTEYYLGNMHVDYATLSSKLDNLNPPKRMIGSEERAYFPVLYTQGTACDITGKPRTTTVLYICDENARNQIHSTAEVASCTYEVIVITSNLCSHPAYRPAVKKDHDIVCYSTDEDQDGKPRESPKPMSLLQMEKTHQDTFKREYTILHTSPTDNEVDEAVERAIEEFQRKMEEEQEVKLAGQKKQQGIDTLANNRLIVQDTVNRIFSGKECIYGGQGWWKYEFCYGRVVTQFHVEPNGDRIDIVLGQFDAKIHKAWLEQDTEKRQPKKYDNQVMQVSHMYVKGDVCEETGAHRSVEVRIRCKTASGSSLAISISLSEPHTCQYILIVESERFCEPLQYADEYGLIELEHVPSSKKDHSSDFGLSDLPV